MQLKKNNAMVKKIKSENKVACKLRRKFLIFPDFMDNLWKSYYKPPSLKIHSIPTLDFITTSPHSYSLPWRAIVIFLLNLTWNLEFFFQFLLKNKWIFFSYSIDIFFLCVNAPLRNSTTATELKVFPLHYKIF